MCNCELAIKVFLKNPPGEPPKVFMYCGNKDVSVIEGVLIVAESGGMFAAFNKDEWSYYTRTKKETLMSSVGEQNVRM